MFLRTLETLTRPDDYAMLYFNRCQFWSVVQSLQRTVSMSMLQCRWHCRSVSRYDHDFARNPRSPRMNIYFVFYFTIQVTCKDTDNDMLKKILHVNLGT